MQSQIVVYANDIPDKLLARAKGKDELHRISRFIDWMADHKSIMWLQPDLLAYRDHLFDEGLANTSISSHLATVRGGYRALLRDNALRQKLYEQTPPESSPADRKAFVDEVLTRLENALTPSVAPVRLIKHQDELDETHVRLTPDQAISLLELAVQFSGE